MRHIVLCLALVAGAAAAQPATMNCRSGATPCSAAAFTENSPTGPAFHAKVGAGQFVMDNGTAGWGIWTNSGDATMNFQVGALTAFQINGAASAYAFTQNWPINSSAASGSNGFSLLTTGAWLDLGGGTNDRLKSDGTSVLFDTNALPASNDTSTLGSNSGSLSWQRLDVTRGVILGASSTVKWTNPPVSDNTEVASQAVWNSDTQEPAVATTTRKYNPLGQEKEWVVEKRWLMADVGIENSNCPLAAVGLKGSGATAVTYSCTDAAAASQSTLSGETYRILNTTAVAATVSIVDVSANVTELQFGPKYLQRVSIPVGSNASVRIWVALVPTGTSLSAVDTGALSLVGFRFSTAVPDTNWQACSGNGASVTCVDTGVAPATASNITLEVDCREATKCRFLINGSLVASQITSGNLPAQTTQLAPRALVSTLNTTAKALWYGRSSVQTN